MSVQKFSFNMRIYLTILIIISGLNLIESYNYSDTCYYYDVGAVGDGHYPCGDICVNSITNICYCGSKKIRNNFDDAFHIQYCCTPPSVKCKENLLGASCPEGEVLEAGNYYMEYPEKFDVDGAPPCNGRCYNDYLTSEYLSTFSHYSQCPI